MIKIEIYLKSGHTMFVKCEDWSFTFDKVDGEYTGYKFSGLTEPKQLGICPDQIAGYIIKK